MEELKIQKYKKMSGKNISPKQKPLGERVMVSRDTTIKPTLRIDNCSYKGNAVLNANK